MKERILITAGGTGGHLFPAIAVAEKLENYECRFIGGGVTESSLFNSGTFPYQEISCGGFHPKNLLKIYRGIRESRHYIQTFNPRLIVGFGSYHTFPVLAAAVSEKVPFILHESNCIPGKVNKWMSHFAEITGTFLPVAPGLIKGKTVPVDMPLRKQYTLGTVERKVASNYFSINSDIPTLLVFGGSQGSKAINTFVIEALNKNKILKNCQYLHFTGDEKTCHLLQKLYAENGITACVKDFEPRMDLAWQTADFCISRSGAGSIAEQIEFEVPGILIPYPYAAENHQEKNGLFMQEHVKGSIVMQEKHLTGESLFHRVTSLFSDNRQDITAMREGIQNYKNTLQRKNAFVDLIEMTIR